jgi:hypothetical protein
MSRDIDAKEFRYSRLLIYIFTLLAAFSPFCKGNKAFKARDDGIGDDATLF